ncbi:MAG: hypothetical protein JWP78_1263 [Mucilaginibacter sp.]|jgi:hypothetical protein|nr:hypothetical protein [Mucilaginibacter sp.]
MTTLIIKSDSDKKQICSLSSHKNWIYTFSKAMQVIDAIADFVESKSTIGRRARYAPKLKSAIEK